MFFKNTGKDNYVVNIKCNIYVVNFQFLNFFKYINSYFTNGILGL